MRRTLRHRTRRQPAPRGGHTDAHQAIARLGKKVESAELLAFQLAARGGHHPSVGGDQRHLAHQTMRPGRVLEQLTGVIALAAAQRHRDTIVEQVEGVAHRAQVAIELLGQDARERAHPRRMLGFDGPMEHQQLQQRGGGSDQRERHAPAHQARLVPPARPHGLRSAPTRRAATHGPTTIGSRR